MNWSLIAPKKIQVLTAKASTIFCESKRNLPMCIVTLTELTAKLQQINIPLSSFFSPYCPFASPESQNPPYLHYFRHSRVGRWGNISVSSSHVQNNLKADLFPTQVKRPPIKEIICFWPEMPFGKFQSKYSWQSHKPLKAEFSTGNADRSLSTVVWTAAL